MSKLLIRGKPVRVEYRCIPCGVGLWDEAPDTAYYVRPVHCGRSMVPTGRVENDGDLLSLAFKHKEAA